MRAMGGVEGSMKVWRRSFYRLVNSLNLMKDGTLFARNWGLFFSCRKIVAVIHQSPSWLELETRDDQRSDKAIRVPGKRRLWFDQCFRAQTRRQVLWLR